MLTCSASRVRSKAQIRQVVLLQSQWRRKQAVKELRHLKTEAKSAAKYKETSYHLENKVVELTQNLQKRTAENKELSAKLAALDEQVNHWQGKHSEASAARSSLEEKLAIPSVPVDQFEEAVRAKNDAEERLRAAMQTAETHEAERVRLSQEMDKMMADLEDRTSAHEVEIAKNMEHANTVAHLQAELQSLKEQISRNNAMNALTKGQRDAPTSPTFANGLRQFENVSGPTASRRRPRRHSTGHGMHARKLSHDEILASRKNGMANPRAVSVMFPSDIMRPRDSNGLPTVSDSSADEIVRLLEDEAGLDDDVLGGLINNLKIPAALAHNPPLAKEVLFPAHLISLISNEMWKLGMIPESERFLANVMQSIQAYVMVS